MNPTTPETGTTSAARPQSTGRTFAAAVRAEFRKILTVRTWWVLALVLVLPVLGLAWTTALVTWAIGEGAGIGLAPTAVLGFARGTNLGSVFAMVFGLLAVSGEHRDRTIETSLLMSGRRHLLGAKLLAYTVMGMVFGVVVVLSCGLGALMAGPNTWPSPGHWLAMSAMGVLAMTLWTLLGVGLGALVTKPWIVVSSAVLYTLLIETFVINSVLRAVGAARISAYLPNTAGDGMLSDLATVLYFVEANQRGGTIGIDREVVLAAAGGSSNMISESVHMVASWPTSTLVFLAWTAAFVTAGCWVTLRRDLPG